MHLPIPSSLPIYTAVVPLLVYPVWAGGGTVVAWQGPLVWLSGWAWGVYLLFGRGRGERIRRLFRDPSFWLAAAFLFYLCLQAWNSGRMRTFDFDTNQWTYSLPPHPGLPWSFTSLEAWEMLRWFAPPLTVFLILRQAWTRISPRTLILLIGANGVLNAGLVFLHRLRGWDNRMYGVRPFGSEVCGSFGYPNNAASYLIILCALALGMLGWELLREPSERTAWSLAGWGSAAAWIFAAATLSGSRTGILGVVLLLTLVLGSLLGIGWPRLHPVQRILALFGVAGGVAALFGVYRLFLPPDIGRELREATVELDLWTELRARWFQIRSAVAMWIDHPWYGVGGWGYRYLVGEYLAPGDWGLLLKKGRANVHHDLIQFLAEFGLIGFSLLAGVFLSTLTRLAGNLFRAPTRDHSLWSHPLRIAGLWGLALVFAHSCIDIPFRSPAVLIHTTVLLLLLTPHPQLPALWNPVVRFTT